MYHYTLHYLTSKQAKQETKQCLEAILHEGTKVNGAAHDKP